MTNVCQLANFDAQLQAQFSQFLAAQSQAQQEKGRFPTQGTNASAHFVGNTQYPSAPGGPYEEAKAVTTRSGRVLEQPVAPKAKPAPPPEPVITMPASPDREVEKEVEIESEGEEESREVEEPFVTPPTTPSPESSSTPITFSEPVSGETQSQSQCQSSLLRVA